MFLFRVRQTRRHDGQNLPVEGSVRRGSSPSNGPPRTPPPRSVRPPPCPAAPAPAGPGATAARGPGRPVPTPGGRRGINVHLTRLATTHGGHLRSGAKPSPDRSHANLLQDFVPRPLALRARGSASYRLRTGPRQLSRNQVAAQRRVVEVRAEKLEELRVDRRGVEVTAAGGGDAGPVPYRRDRAVNLRSGPRTATGYRKTVRPIREPANRSLSTR